MSDSPNPYESPGVADSKGRLDLPADQEVGFRRVSFWGYVVGAVGIAGINLGILVTIRIVNTYWFIRDVPGLLLVFGVPAIAISAVVLVSVRWRVYSLPGIAFYACAAVAVGVFNALLIAIAMASV